MRPLFRVIILSHMNSYTAPLAIIMLLCYKRGAPAGYFAAKYHKTAVFLRAPCNHNAFML